MELTGANIIQVPPVLNLETTMNLRNTLEVALGDGPFRVLVLLGEEKVFCRGMELVASHNEHDARIAVECFAACLEMLRVGPKPAIAFVQGEAAGGGVGLAAACDALLATTESTFTLPELLFGLTPAVIFPYVAQRINLQKLRWIGLTAGTMSGSEAMEAGLADAVCAPEKAPALLRSWIRKLLRVDPTATGSWKRMTTQAPPPGSKDGIEVTLQRLGDASVRERILAFLESGEPPWMGKE